MHEQLAMLQTGAAAPLTAGLHAALPLSHLQVTRGPSSCNSWKAPQESLTSPVPCGCSVLTTVQQQSALCVHSSRSRRSLCTGACRLWRQLSSS
jgi:hypothetical protein